MVELNLRNKEEWIELQKEDLKQISYISSNSGMILNNSSYNDINKYLLTQEK